MSIPKETATSGFIQSVSKPRGVFTQADFKIMTGATPANAARYYQPMVNALANFGISDNSEIAAIMATIAIESDHLAKVKEDLYYKDPERLANLFRRVFDTNNDKKISPEEVAYAAKFTHNSAALGQKLYGGFMGRGLGQVTWEGNYRRIGNMLGIDYVKEPELMERPDHAALSMVAFWVDGGFGKVAADPKAVRRLWNGPLALKTAEQTTFYNDAMKVLA